MVNHRAFTLIELVVVISIIALLTTMIFAGAQYVRNQARAYDTRQRIEGVITGLRQAGIAGRGAAEVLHGEVIAPWGTARSPVVATGVTRFAVSTGRFYSDTQSSGGGLLVPDQGTWLVPNAYLWNTPWGRPQLDAAGGLGGIMATHALNELTPLATAAFLARAGVLDDPTDWPGDASAFPDRRKPARAWNDAWGNPLVVAFAFYQPGQNTTVSTTWTTAGNNITPRTGIFPDLFARQALQAYGFNRAVYLAVGAVGPRVRSTPLSASADALAVALWSQITDVCGAAEWTEASWASPPTTWSSGVRSGKQGAERCFLSAPIELR